MKRYALLLIVGLVLTIPAQARITEEDVMACWLFENGKGNIVTDVTGNGYDAELTGAVDWDAGKYGKGLRIDGGQVLVPGSEEAFQLTTFTLLAWLQPEVTGGFQGVIHKEEGGVAGRTFLMYLNPSGKPSCSISQGGTNSDFVSNTVITDGTWHHVAITFDGETRIATIYVDGVPNGSKEYPEDIPQHGTMVKLNKTNFRGSIDEVLIASAVMEEEEILAAMEGLNQFLTFAVTPAGKLATTWGRLRR